MATTRDVRRERSIAADPTSLALLLAGPTGVDLWPGARRLGEVAGRIRVEAALPGSRELGEAPVQVLVRADAPRRTPVAFVCDFGWQADDERGADVPVAGADARLTLSYQGDETTRAALSIHLGAVAGADRAEEVDEMAAGFLDNLAAAAQARSRAA